MDIIPAWLIEELRKIEEEKRERDRPRIHVDIPLPPIEQNADEQDPEEFAIVISLR